MPDYQPRAIFSMRHARQANADAGQFWFTPGTMRFFASRLGETVYACGTLRVSYFTSSERFTRLGAPVPGYPRKYSLRVIDWDTGHIDTVGEFQQYTSAAAARRAARNAARNAMGPPLPSRD
jgi:hypothetical protein